MGGEVDTEDLTEFRSGPNPPRPGNSTLHPGTLSPQSTEITTRFWPATFAIGEHPSLFHVFS